MKEIKWIGSSYKDLIAFPKDMRREAGYNLDRVQRGLDPADWKPMSTIGIGVKEIRIHGESEYRVIYIAKFRDVVFVLHAFKKKTNKTTKKDLDIAKARYKIITTVEK